jgi:hypothetical protein
MVLRYCYHLLVHDNLEPLTIHCILTNTHTEKSLVQTNIKESIGIISVMFSIFNHLRPCTLVTTSVIFAVEITKNAAKFTKIYQIVL